MPSNRGSVSAAARVAYWIKVSVPRRDGERKMLAALEIALEALEGVVAGEEFLSDQQARQAIERMADALEQK